MRSFKHKYRIIDKIILKFCQNNIKYTQKHPLWDANFVLCSNLNWSNWNFKWSKSPEDVAVREQKLDWNSSIACIQNNRYLQQIFVLYFKMTANLNGVRFMGVRQWLKEINYCTILINIMSALVAQETDLCFLSLSSRSVNWLTTFKKAQVSFLK